MAIAFRRHKTPRSFSLFHSIQPLRLLLAVMLFVAVSRIYFIKAMTFSMMSLFLSSSEDEIPKLYQPKFLPLPADVPKNTSVFGKILRGELPLRYRDESPDLLAFRDKTPRAPTHILIIPKRFIESIFDLTHDDLPLLYESKEMAMRLLQREQPEALARGDYRLVFHAPPFNSVDHLHLHVLAPASDMSLFHRTVKNHFDTRWCVSLDRVVSRLEADRSALPYERPDDAVTATWRKRKDIDLFGQRK
jgi:diadenosine tetraphosphate (Ap4A) HIT family hydrolase